MLNTQLPLRSIKMAMECRNELSFALPVEPPRRCASNVFSSHLWCRERKLVCVTSGNSYFGAHLIRKLLVRGYLVRATIQNQVDFEEMKELLREEEMKQLESVVVARMTDLDCLCEAFRGCHAVFHTSSFIDPHGISGYTERMAFLETEAAGNVIEACSKTAYARRCIFTSSLLASIWKGNNHEHDDLDESSWTDEDFCRENKLWFALAKTRAEKVAWRKAMETKVKLVTVCPALVMAPSFPHADTESSLPYLKGGQVMLRQGVLATEDVDKAAEAHVFVYEEMDYGACGRYLCFGRTITTPEDAVLLENRLKMQGLLSAYESGEIPARLCKSKLTRLLFHTARRLSCKHR
ncbi:PREDICTED: cinnamoyl-CoA reductase-like SNL6 [Ipomoea nil]|uniref:cinnamoyl-CoA reductase-like SNL6 n=1 Tax=Ipomoea nil TaxID=35883 RepID=UPI0009011C16|nr:PREDICTED: cinnamoyl-CoA reductase-like SNL6 [Ipomoea nil]